jgi:glycerol uptake facilitator-like aquaporin
MNHSRQLAAEGLGTALLLATVVGSGIMGERLAGGNVAIALLANALATGAGLLALIHTFGPISGAHFNPAVTLSAWYRGDIRRTQALGFIAVQIVGAIIGVAAAHLMFGEPLFSASHHVRSGNAQWFSEFIATFGLITVIITCSRHNRASTPVAVACYIVAAYWFTASTSFANPAVTLARSLTDTFAGIRPEDVAGFVVAQLLGAGVGTVFSMWLIGCRK